MPETARSMKQKFYNLSGLVSNSCSSSSIDTFGSPCDSVSGGYETEIRAGRRKAVML
jgi:hypothetical protein